MWFSEQIFKTSCQLLLRSWPLTWKRFYRKLLVFTSLFSSQFKLQIIMISDLLAYCGILLHDRISIDPSEARDDSYICELFVRNSLKVPSTSRVRQYFEEEIVGKSAITEISLSANSKAWYIHCWTRTCQFTSVTRHFRIQLW